MTESGFTDSLRKQLIKRGIYCLKLNLRFMKGVPDCWYSGAAGDLWNEHKYFQKLPQTIDLTAGRTPMLTHHQQQWLEARYNEGRNVAVIVGSPEGHVLFPALDWQAPITRDEYLEQSLKTADFATKIADQLN